MFIGHFGAGLAAKAMDKRPSLGTLFLAAQFIDLLWPIFLLLGLEQVRLDPGNTAFTPLDFVHYPYTHSFLAVFIWAFLFGLVHFALRKNLKSSVVLGILVMSHWFLDLVTHRPDLPLTFWDDLKVGLGLWNSVLFTLILESAIFVTGAFLFLKATKAKNTTGHISLWSLLVFLALMYVLNAFGPPPPSAEPIAYVGLTQWLIVAWGYWIDRNRFG